MKNQVKTQKVVKKAKISKRVERKLDKISKFDAKNAGSWEILQHVSNVAEVETFSLSKVIKIFLNSANKSSNGLTKSQRDVLTFANVVEYVRNSEKFSHLTHFTFHQVKLICNDVIKSKDLNTKRAAKVAKQGGVMGKKADKVAKRGAAADTAA